MAFMFAGGCGQALVTHGNHCFRVTPGGMCYLDLVLIYPFCLGILHSCLCVVFDSNWGLFPNYFVNYFNAVIFIYVIVKPRWDR